MFVDSGPQEGVDQSPEGTLSFSRQLGVFRLRVDEAADAQASPDLAQGHAIDALGALGLRRWRRPESVRVAAVLAASASYASLFLLLLWEALRGLSVVAPDATALASLAIWATGTVLTLGLIGFGSRSPSRNGLDRRTA